MKQDVADEPSKRQLSMSTVVVVADSISALSWAEMLYIFVRRIIYTPLHLTVPFRRTGKSAAALRQTCVWLKLLTISWTVIYLILKSWQAGLPCTSLSV